MNLKRTCRYYYLRFIRLKGDPQSLALGTAIGVFFGITPILPFHALVNLIVTFVTRTSTIASILATTLICNPLTYVPLYYFSTVIGNFVTPYNLHWEQIKNLLEFLLAKPGITESMQAIAGLGYEAIIVLLVGGSLLALPFTAVSYVLSLRLFIKIRESRNQRHLLS